MLSGIRVLPQVLWVWPMSHLAKSCVSFRSLACLIYLFPQRGVCLLLDTAFVAAGHSPG